MARQNNAEESVEKLLREAYRSVLQQPVPERLLALLERKKGKKERNS